MVERICETGGFLVRSERMRGMRDDESGELTEQNITRPTGNGNYS